MKRTRMFCLLVDVQVLRELTMSKHDFMRELRTCTLYIFCVALFVDWLPVGCGVLLTLVMLPCRFVVVIHPISVTITTVYHCTSL